MINAVPFDTYGTLIDTQAGLGKLTELVGDAAPAVFQLGDRNSWNTAFAGPDARLLWLFHLHATR